MRPEVHIAEAGPLRDRLLRDVSAEAARSIRAHGLFALALPGGSVAVNTFPSLAALPLDWSRVHFFWVDERAVDPSDPESNYGSARALWLDPLKIDAGRVHRMAAEGPDLAAAAAAYADELTEVLGAGPRLDFVLLGVGPDGHVASLFPGHTALQEDHLSVVAVTDAPKPPPRRLTLTLPVLVNAERVVVVAYGASKAEALRAAVDHSDSPLPLALVLRRTKRALVLADDAAGSLLPPSYRM